MKRKILLGSLSIASVMMFTGCAGIISGSTQHLTIKSNVDGATVELNGRSIGQTPLSTMIEKKKDLFITVKKDGYHDVTLPLNTSVDPMALAGLISYSTPLTTDVVQGTAYQINPSYYHVELKKKD